MEGKLKERDRFAGIGKLGHKRLSLSMGLALLSPVAQAAINLDNETDEIRCLVQALKTAKDTTLVAELKEQCKPIVEPLAEPSEQPLSPAVTRRIVAERQATERGFAITAHRPNYILPFTYNDQPNNEPFDAIGQSGFVEEIEALLQVSIKVPIAQRLWNTDTDVYFAYTNRAWWQAYNDGFSRPFRETNYEPEVFLRHFSNTEFLGINLVGWDVGFNHQSNGRTQLLSRSWNRLFALGIFQLDEDLTLGTKIWYRLPEDDEDDEMPNEYRTLGYGELRFIYTPSESTYTAMIRPGTEKAGVELTWSHPVNEHFRFYMQYFYGYGESLLDYEARSERFGIGFAINDFL